MPCTNSPAAVANSTEGGNLHAQQLSDCFRSTAAITQMKILIQSEDDMRTSMTMLTSLDQYHIERVWLCGANKAVTVHLTQIGRRPDTNAHVVQERYCLPWLVTVFLA